MKKLSLFLSVLGLLASPLSAHAASSPWFQTDGAQMRLISMTSPYDNTITAGLQVQLHEGWKTYWRSPGGSGLPPQISFEGSRNIAKTELNFPIPESFGSDGNLTAGYKKPVTFPITITPLFNKRPITLKVSGVIGICGQICVPVQFDLSLTEDGKGKIQRDIASTLQQSSNKLAGKERADFQVEEAHYSFENGKTLIVTARVPEKTTQATLFVEGPNDWYLTPVKAAQIKDGQTQFTVDLANIPETAPLDKTNLHLTLSADGKGIEKKITPRLP